jgi:hypothetical protein
MERPASFFQLFLAALLGGIAALMLWNFGGWAWRNMGWLLVVVAVIWFTLNVVNLIIYWLNGRRSLDQWPDPHGRYYYEWLSLPESAGAYYEWLAQKMGNREPWSSWARADHALGQHR